VGDCRGQRDRTRPGGSDLTSVKPRLSHDEARRRLQEHHDRVIAGETEARRRMTRPEDNRLMVDPSFLFSEDAVMWLEDPAVLRGIVVPATFAEWLGDTRRTIDLAAFVSPEDRDQYWGRLDQLAEVLSDVAVFRDADRPLSTEALEVLSALRQADDTAARILAEEWTFLESNSWAVSKLRYPLDAFRDAGAVIVEYGRKFRDDLIEHVISHDDVPAVLTPAFLAKVAAKWVIVGGTHVGADALAGGLAGPLPGMAAEGAVAALLKAIDP
jgi:hypothetical protein